MIERIWRLAFLLLFLSVAPWAQASGPAVFATIDRATWPQPLDGPGRFDTASRAEILMFGKVLLDSEVLDEVQLSERLGTRQIDAASVERVRQRFWKRLLDNYRLASGGCEGQPFCFSVGDVGELRQRLASFTVDTTSPYFRWSLASRRFHDAYLNEQLRLAALFPHISSEIQSFDDSERNGDELADRQFLLSFDDGPTAPAGNTDKLIALLHEQHLHAMFFVLGNNLQARLGRTSAQDLQHLYDGQCVALHGWEHRSHATWDEWWDSVSRTAALVKGTLPDDYQPLFRPPYGQRRSDARAELGLLGIRVSLWNIDSQDWSRAMSAEQAEQRVQTLMLLWRRGIILFHDIHIKAQGAVPELVKGNRADGVQWLDCHKYR